MKWIKIVFRYLMVALVGFGLGYLCKSERLARDPDQKMWDGQFSEERNHWRILQFQETMEELKANGAKNPDDLTKQLDAQLRIEDLILKSRETEYAKWLPITPLFSGVLGAVFGALAGRFLGRKPSGSPDA